jgi:ribonuclease H2 subunit A
MGIDEAGRGPVLGPMVYGCCYWPVKYRELCAKLGFADSKELSEIERDSLFEVI